MLSNAKWIVPCDYDENGNYYFSVRRNFELSAPPAAAVLRVSADSRFRAVLNGVEVGRGPVRGSTTLQYFEEYDISGLLRAGGNMLLIEAYSIGEENFVVNSVSPGVIAEIPGIIATGSDWEARTEPAWQRESPHFTMQSGRTEWKDMRAEEGEWKSAVVNESGRLNGKQLLRNELPPMNERRFFPADIPVLFSVGNEVPRDPEQLSKWLFKEPMAEIQPGRITGLDTLMGAVSQCRIAAGESGVRLAADFCCEVSGRLELDVDSEADGVSVDVSYGEYLMDGRICTEFRSDYHFTDRYILRKGINHLGTNLGERGFRLVQLVFRNLQQGGVTIRRIAGVDIRYPFARRADFFCSDYRLNRIYEVCRETLSACATDTFTDCPWRERAFWVNDLVVNNLANLVCFGPQEIHRHCFEMTFSQPHETGLFSAVVPLPHMPDQPDFIFPATNLFLVLMLRDYWMYSGDDATLRKHMPSLEQILKSIWALADEEGILRSSGSTADWNFFDWSFELNDYHCNGTRESMLSSLFLLASDVFRQLAEAVNYDYDRGELDAHCALTAANFEERFVDKNTGLIADEVVKGESELVKLNTQLAHALWLLTGRASAERRPAFLAALTDDKCMMPDYYLHYFWFQAARLADALPEGLRRIRKYWGQCIDTGTSTLYEAGIHSFGRQAMHGSGSLCHAFGTIPVDFFQSTILGIVPVEAGFRTFTFAPNLFDLEFAQGRVTTPAGNISVRIAGGKAVLRVPVGTRAQLADGTYLAAGEHEVTL